MTENVPVGVVVAMPTLPFARMVRSESLVEVANVEGELVEAGVGGADGGDARLALQRLPDVGLGMPRFVVDRIGYPWFYCYTATLAVPALVLLYFLARRMRQGAR